jgi:hypothetical protein
MLPKNTIFTACIHLDSPLTVGGVERTGGGLAAYWQTQRIIRDKKKKDHTRSNTKQ